MDLRPTLLGLAGQTIPKAVEGMDLSHIALGKGGPAPEAALLQGLGHTYLWQDGFEWRALRDQRYTYARYLREGRELLFDHNTDPFQKQNLASAEAHRDTLPRLRTQMNARLSKIGDTFEKSLWYRDQFTENRVLVRGVRGPFHRELGVDIPIETGRPAPAPPTNGPSRQP